MPPNPFRRGRALVRVFLTTLRMLVLRAETTHCCQGHNKTDTRMSAVTFESSKNSLGSPPEAHSVRRLLVWGGYAGAVLGSAVLFQGWQMEAVPPVIYLLGMAVLALCLLPITIWQAGRREGAPMFELLCLACALAYSVPVFLHENFIRNYNTYTAISWEALQRALAITIMGIAAMMAGYYLVLRSPMAQGLHRADLPMNPRRLTLLFFVVFGVGGGLRVFERLTVGSSSGLANALSSLLTFVLGAGIALMAFRVFQPEGGSRHGSKPILYGVVGALALTGIGTGMLEDGFVPLIVLMGARWSANRRVPIVWLLLGAAAIIVLNSAKGEYRSEVWYVDKSASIPERMALWADKSTVVVNSMTYPNGLNDAIVRTVHRFDLIHIFAHVVELTPGEIPHYGGASYGYLLYGWIPRAIWPDKPIAQDANVLFAMDYGLIIEAQRDSTRMGLGFLTEAYANYGVLGVLGVMFLIGSLFGAVGRIFNGPQSDGGRAAYISVLAFYLNGIGSATTMFFFFGIQGFVAVPLILRYFALSWRAPAGLSKAERV